MGITRKWLIVGAKGTQIWASGGVCCIHASTFNLEHVKVIWWGYWVHFPQTALYLKKAHHRGKLTKLGQVSDLGSFGALFREKGA